MYTFIESYGRTKVVGRVVIETAIIMGIKFNNYLIKTIQTVIILHACFRGKLQLQNVLLLVRHEDVWTFLHHNQLFDYQLA